MKSPRPSPPYDPGGIHPPRSRLHILSLSLSSSEILPLTTPFSHGIPLTSKPLNTVAVARKTPIRPTLPTPLTLFLIHPIHAYISPPTNTSPPRTKPNNTNPLRRVLVQNIKIRLVLRGTIRFLAGATGEIGHEVALLVGAVFGVRGAGGVGVEEVLGD